jgi:hypothetical protein
MGQPARSTENAHFKSEPDRVFGLKIANIFAAARADSDSVKAAKIPCEFRDDRGGSSFC